MELMLAVLAAILIHEGGHYLAALWFGHRLRYRLDWGVFQKLKIKIPRYTWDMPLGLSKWQEKVVSVAGFGLEFLAAIAFVRFYPGFGLVYLSVAVGHFIAYPFYRTDMQNDFQALKVR